MGRARGAPSHRRSERWVSPRVPWRPGGVGGSRLSPLSLSLSPQSNDLLWDDYEAKLADQAVRLMENYLAQFGDFKVPPCEGGWGWGQGGTRGGPGSPVRPPPRSASPSGAESSWTTTAPGTTWRLCRAPRKRTRPKSPRLGFSECPRTAPKWGQSPVGDKATNPPRPSPQAEEEFNKAQAVFEDLNRELREELPVLYGRYGAVPGLGTPRGLGDIRGAGGHCGGLGTSWRDITWAWGHHGSGTLRGSVTRWGLRDIVALRGSVGAWGHCGAGGHRHG